MPRLPRIGITVGDPAGIGPEIAVKAAADPRVREACEPILYGPHHRQDLAGFRAGPAVRRSRARRIRRHRPRRRRRGRGTLDAIATAPINKEAFALAGLPWKGHTDLLAHLTGTPRVAMMFYAEALRVVLATVHVPLADVPDCSRRSSLERTIDLTARELPRFGCPSPRIAVAGLNPHAGEHGLIGREDDEVLAPGDRGGARDAAST